MNIRLLDRPLTALMICKEAGEGQFVQELLNQSPIGRNVSLHLHQAGNPLPSLHGINLVIISVAKGAGTYPQLLEAVREESLQVPVLVLGMEHIADPSHPLHLGAQVVIPKIGLDPVYWTHALSWALEKGEWQRRMASLEATYHHYFWEVDTKKNRWYASEAFHKALGSKIQSLNQYLHKVHPDEQHKVASAFMQAIRSNSPIKISHNLGENNSLTVHLEGFTFQGPDGSVNRLAGNIRLVAEAAAPAAEPTSPSEHPQERPHKAPYEPISHKAEERPAASTGTSEVSYQNGNHGYAEKYTDISYLKQVSGGDTDIMRKAIGKYLETTPEVIRQLDHELNTQDFDQLAKTAHKLKSSVGLMGMTDLQKTVQNIELVAKSRERLDVLPVLVSRTKKMLSQSLTELQQEIATL